MPPLSAEARNLNWLLNTFTTTTTASGVTHAIVVSADGLPIAVCEDLDRAMANQLAAIASGLVSLTQGAARSFNAGLFKQTVVEMEEALLLLMTISDGSCLAVLAAADCDIGMVAYEMAVLVARFGEALTPRLRAELHAARRA
jgi:predicted regulator of Ras-like GTPase activity (Roadblock/LC7/MglB family)